MLNVRHLTAFACVTVFAQCALAEQVDNPAYLAWAKYKPGTTVTCKNTHEMLVPNDATPHHREETIIQKLVDIKPDTITIEVVRKTTINGQEHEQPPRTGTLPAKIDADQEGVPQLPMDMGQKPEVKDMKVAKETINLNGQQIETVTHEFSTDVKIPRGTTMHVKTWSSPNIPGSLVKMEINGEGPTTVHGTIMVTDYHIEP